MLTSSRAVTEGKRRRVALATRNGKRDNALIEQDLSKCGHLPPPLLRHLIQPLRIDNYSLGPPGVGKWR